MNTTIRAIAEICREHPFIEKRFFVPSYSVGLQIGEHLARRGIPWINLRWTTMSGYALGLVSLELSSKKTRLINEQERLIIVEQLIRDGETPLQYFRKAADTPGIVSSLAKAIHESRMAGFTSRTMKPEAFIVKEKGEELIWLLTAYERHLQEKRFTDHAGILEMAIQRLENKRQLKNDTIFMTLSDFPLTELEKRLIRMAGGDRLIVVNHTRPAGLDTPPRFFAVAPEEEEIPVEPHSDVDLLRWMFDPHNALKPFGDGTVSMFRALGESNEVREALRRILTDGIPFDDVEIIVTQTDPYFSLIYELCQSSGIPVTFAGGLPVTYSRPGRALLLYLQWIAEDFQEKYMKALIGSGLLDMERCVYKGSRPQESVAVGLMREAAIGWGRERYLARLDMMIDACRTKSKAGQDQLRFENLLWLRDLLGALLAIAPDTGDGGTVSTDDVYRRALLFLSGFSRCVSEMDESALDKLTSQLQSLLEAEPIMRPFEEAAERLGKEIASLSVFHRTPRPDCLHVSHYRSTGCSSRSHTFVLGLSQDSFPGSLHQDPVILDLECETLGPSLSQSGDLLHENVYIMAKVICSRQGRVSLSYSCRDLADDRERFPASIMLGAHRAISGRPDDDYSALIEYMKEPAGFVPGPEMLPLNDCEWWLGQRGLFYTNDSLYSSYPCLCRGDRAEAERQKILLCEYEGLIRSIGQKGDTAPEVEVFSCSRLEEMARCPFRFFLHYKLRLEPLKEMEKDCGRWLDPLQRGSLLHDIFYRFMKILKERGERPNLKDHLAQMEEIARDEIGQLRTEIPCARDLVLERESAEIMDALPIFLRDEEERCRGNEPVHFELSFGIEDEEPVLIHLGSGVSFRLRGMIDRIDRCEEHRYEIWDYKSGSFSTYKEHGYVDGGRQLQHALYAIAAETVLKRDYDPRSQVVLGGYFFPTVKGEGRRIPKKMRRELLYEALDALLQMLRRGIFPASYDDKPCTYCDYSRICGGAKIAVKRSKDKLETDPNLEPFNRLKSCE